MNEQQNQQPVPPTIPQPSQTTEISTGQPLIQAPAVSKRSKTLALWFGIGGIVAFVLQILFGVYLLATVAISAWSIYVGVRLKLKYLIVLGSIGAVLNLLAYTLAVIFF